MKTFFAAIVVLFSAVQMSAQEVLDLREHGKLTLYLLGDWKSDVSTLGRGVTLTLKSTKESTNTTATLSVTFPEKDLFSRKDRLKMQVEIEGQGYVEQSVEGRAYAREFKLTSGTGFYCNFTDPNLRGKPVKIGDYKVVTVGKIRLSPTVLVDVFIGGEGFSTEAYNHLLGAIEGMEFSGPGR